MNNLILCALATAALASSSATGTSTETTNVGKNKWGAWSYTSTGSPISSSTSSSEAAKTSLFETNTEVDAKWIGSASGNSSQPAHTKHNPTWGYWNKTISSTVSSTATDKGHVWSTPKSSSIPIGHPQIHSGPWSESHTWIESTDSSDSSDSPNSWTSWDTSLGSEDLESSTSSSSGFSNSFGQAEDYSHLADYPGVNYNRLIGGGYGNVLVGDVPAHTQLKPAIPRGIDPYSTKSLKPRPAGDAAPLYFADSSDYSKPLLSATAMFDFGCHTINIDHSAYMSASIDEQGLLVIKFSSQSAYDVARAAWTGITEFMIIGHIAGCGNYDAGELCYYMSHSFTFDADRLSCFVNGQDTKIEDAATDFEFQWDMWSPDVGGKTGTSGSGQGSGATPGSSNNTVDNTNSTSSDSSNSTISDDTIQDLTTANYTRCIAPVDTKYGLPTACLGYTFDHDIDSQYNYTNWVTDGLKNALGNAALQISTDQLLEGDLNDSGYSTVLRKRNFVSNLVEGAKSGLSATGSVFSKAGEAVLTSAQNKAKNLPVKIPAVNVPVDHTTKDLGLSFKFPGEKSPLYSTHKKWKNAIKLFEWAPDETVIKQWSSRSKNIKWKGSNGKLSQDKLTKGVKTAAEARVRGYCVGCGMSGSVNAVGYAKGSFADGFTAAGVDFTTDIRARVALGLDGEFEVNLAKVSWTLLAPTGKFSIPGLIAVGPYVSASVEVVPKLTIAGTVEIGAEMQWSKARGRVGWNDNKPHVASGWTPDIKPIAELEAEIGLAVDIGLPVSVSFGIAILNKKYEMSIAGEVRPSLEGKISIGGSVSLNQEKDKSLSVETKRGSEECQGAKFELAFKNTVGFVANLPNKSKILIGGKFLHEYEKNLTSGCKKLWNDTKADTKDTKAKRSNVRRYLTDISPLLHARQEQDDFWTVSSGYFTVEPLNSTNVSNDTNSTLLPSDWTFPAANLIDMMNATSNETTYEDASFSIGSAEIKPYNTTDGWGYNTLVDPDHKGMVVACSDLNLYLQPYDTVETKLLLDSGCGALWEFERNVTDSHAVFSDGTGKILHYHPIEMETTGAARLRLSDMYEIPEETVPIAFIQPQSASTFAPYDLGNDIFYGLAVCTYANSADKLFLVKDFDSGLDQLKSADIKYSITGGDVIDCYGLELVIGDLQAPPAWDGSDQDLGFNEEWIENYHYEGFEWDDEPTF